LKFMIDTHTHSISSGHAYSSIEEMARGAKDNGIQAFALTDHGPSMKGAPYLYHFGNLKAIPEKINGVRIIKGVEANIIDFQGNVDLPEDYLKRLEFVIASFHDICITPGTCEEHTNAVINLLKNPYIDAVAHPGNPQFQVEIEKVVKAAKEYDKFIEINNHSFVVRTGSEKNCKEFAFRCKEFGVGITCGSDAHISFDVGKFDNVYKLFKEVDMPKELILNTSIEKLESYLNLRKERIKIQG
jgi:putative hydrolase